MTKKPPLREVTKDEKRLWRLVTQNDTPLYPHDANTASFDIDDYAKEQKTKAPVVIKSITPTPSARPVFFLRTLGDYAGVDKRTAAKFRKGKMPIDMTIDLHGHNQIEAFEQLQTAIAKAANNDMRVLLVITGKGNRGEGVLKQNLPLWLNTASIQPFVLAFDVANTKDGGSGAYYVLLKRNRKPDD